MSGSSDYDRYGPKGHHNQSMSLQRTSQMSFKPPNRSGRSSPGCSYSAIDRRPTPVSYRPTTKRKNEIALEPTMPEPVSSSSSALEYFASPVKFLTSYLCGEGSSTETKGEKQQPAIRHAYNAPKVPKVQAPPQMVVSKPKPIKITSEQEREHEFIPIREEIRKSNDSQRRPVSYQAKNDEAWRRVNTRKPAKKQRYRHSSRSPNSSYTRKSTRKSSDDSSIIKQKTPNVPGDAPIKIVQSGPSNSYSINTSSNIAYLDKQKGREDTEKFVSALAKTKNIKREMPSKTVTRDKEVYKKDVNKSQWKGSADIVKPKGIKISSRPQPEDMLPQTLEHDLTNNSDIIPKPTLVADRVNVTEYQEFFSPDNTFDDARTTPVITTHGDQNRAKKTDKKSSNPLIDTYGFGNDMKKVLPEVKNDSNSINAIHDGSVTTNLPKRETKKGVLKKKELKSTRMHGTFDNTDIIEVQMDEPRPGGPVPSAAPIPTSKMGPSIGTEPVLASQIILKPTLPAKQNKKNNFYSKLKNDVNDRPEHVRHVPVSLQVEPVVEKSNDAKDRSAPICHEPAGRQVESQVEPAIEKRKDVKDYPESIRNVQVERQAEPLIEKINDIKIHPVPVSRVPVESQVEPVIEKRNDDKNHPAHLSRVPVGHQVELVIEKIDDVKDHPAHLSHVPVKRQVEQVIEKRNDVKGHPAPVRRVLIERKSEPVVEETETHFLSKFLTKIMTSLKSETSMESGNDFPDEPTPSRKTPTYSTTPNNGEYEYEIDDSEDDALQKKHSMKYDMSVNIREIDTERPTITSEKQSDCQTPKQITTNMKTPKDFSRLLTADTDEPTSKSVNNEPNRAIVSEQVVPKRYNRSDSYINNPSETREPKQERPIITTEPSICTNKTVNVKPIPSLSTNEVKFSSATEKITEPSKRTDKTVNAKPFATLKPKDAKPPKEIKFSLATEKTTDPSNRTDETITVKTVASLTPKSDKPSNVINVSSATKKTTDPSKRTYETLNAKPFATFKPKDAKPPKEIKFPLATEKTTDPSKRTDETIIAKTVTTLKPKSDKPSNEIKLSSLKAKINSELKKVNDRETIKIESKRDSNLEALARGSSQNYSDKTKAKPKVKDPTINIQETPTSTIQNMKLLEAIKGIGDFDMKQQEQALDNVQSNAPTFKDDRLDEKVITTGAADDYFVFYNNEKTENQEPQIVSEPGRLVVQQTIESIAEPPSVDLVVPPNMQLVEAQIMDVENIKDDLFTVNPLFKKKKIEIIGTNILTQKNEQRFMYRRKEKSPPNWVTHNKPYLTKQEPIYPMSDQPFSRQQGLPAGVSLNGVLAPSRLSSYNRGYQMGGSYGRNYIPRLQSNIVSETPEPEMPAYINNTLTKKARRLDMRNPDISELRLSNEDVVSGILGHASKFECHLVSNQITPQDNGSGETVMVSKLKQTARNDIKSSFDRQFENHDGELTSQSTQKVNRKRNIEKKTDDEQLILKPTLETTLKPSHKRKTFFSKHQKIKEKPKPKPVSNENPETNGVLVVCGGADAAIAMVSTTVTGKKLYTFLPKDDEPDAYTMPWKGKKVVHTPTTLPARLPLQQGSATRIDEDQGPIVLAHTPILRPPSTTSEETATVAKNAKELPSHSTVVKYVHELNKPLPISKKSGKKASNKDVTHFLDKNDDDETHTVPLTYDKKSNSKSESEKQGIESKCNPHVVLSPKIPSVKPTKPAECKNEEINTTKTECSPPITNMKTPKDAKRVFTTDAAIIVKSQESNEGRGPKLDEARCKRVTDTESKTPTTIELKSQKIPKRDERQIPKLDECKNQTPKEDIPQHNECEIPKLATSVPDKQNNSGILFYLSNFLSNLNGPDSERGDIPQ